MYYDEPESLRGLKPDPSRARDILEDLIVDFPFRDEASRQNFYGLLLTPIVRPMLRGHTPMHLVGASLPRTGKSLLTEQVLGGLLYGRATPARQLVGDEGEVEKRILAMLLCGETIINLDNLKEYLDSPSLAMLLTAETFGGRVLGLSVDAMVKNILTIVATGNNVRATGEIAKRIVPIVLLLIVGHAGGFLRWVGRSDRFVCFLRVLALRLVFSYGEIFFAEFFGDDGDDIRHRIV